MRLFIALQIPENIRKRIHDEAEILKKEGLFEGKITEEENIHLTLKFLGDVEEDKIEEIKERLREVKFQKLAVMLGSLGVFDENIVRIIWIKLLGVDELQKEIDRGLGRLFKEDERFMSHITIARVKSVKEKRGLIDRIKKVRLDNLNFKVGSFELMNSKLGGAGPEYSVIEEFELA